MSPDFLPSTFPAPFVEQGLVRHDPTRTEEPTKVRRRLRVKRMRPPLREREGPEALLDVLEELVQGRGRDFAGAQQAIDVPRLPPLDLPRAVRREGLDREGVSRLNDFVPKAADVRHGLPCVEVVSLDRVAREVRDRL